MYRLKNGSAVSGAISATNTQNRNMHPNQQVSWWLGRDLNPRPRDYDPPALPLSYRAVVRKLAFFIYKIANLSRIESFSKQKTIKNANNNAILWLCPRKPYMKIWYIQ